MFVSHGQILPNILDGAAEGNDMMGGSVVVHCGDSIIERWHYGTADLERDSGHGPRPVVLCRSYSLGNLTKIAEVR